MKPGEQEALDQLKLETGKIQDEAFALFREYLRMDEKELQMCGHKTTEAAILHTTKYALARIKKAQDAFLKKFPD